MANRDLPGDKPGGTGPRDSGPRDWKPRDPPHDTGRMIGREWLGSSRSLRRVANRFADELARRAPSPADPSSERTAERRGARPFLRPPRPEAEPAAPRPVAPAEIGALLDLGVTDGAVVAYLLDPANLDAARRPRPPSAHAASSAIVGPGRAPALYRALGRVTAVSMRHQARQLIFQARRSTDPDRRTSLTEHAFALTQAAEDLERRAAAAQGRANDDDAATPKARSRLWHLRAEEYRTLAEALPPGTARDSYLHLARAYDRLAEGFIR